MPFLQRQDYIVAVATANDGWYEDVGFIYIRFDAIEQIFQLLSGIAVVRSPYVIECDYI